MSATRYPLSWPTGWKRTRNPKRARFVTAKREYNQNGSWLRKSSVTMTDALDRLTAELRRLGVVEGDWLLSSNLQTRLDGLPYAKRAQPTDKGVAVYFRLGGQPRVLACDTWDRIEDNIAAVAAHIEAIRAIDRYGVGSLDQAFAGYAALPAKGTTWRTTLGFAPDAQVTEEQIAAAFRERALTAHQDIQGGSHDAMASLTQARTEAMQELQP